MLPRLTKYARINFRSFPTEAREELVQETVANCLVAYQRLFQLGRAHLAYPTVLVRYAVGRIRDGRRVGSSRRAADVLAESARNQETYQIHYLGTPQEQNDGWRERLTENRRTPVPDQVAFRIDFSDWLARHSPRDRRMIGWLIHGEGTQAVARRLGLSPGRISQLRRELHDSWLEFQEESDDPTLADAGKE
jgi:hypothetical protein